MRHARATTFPHRRRVRGKLMDAGRLKARGLANDVRCVTARLAT